MADKKSVAVIVGAALGVAAVATTISIIYCRHKDNLQNMPHDITKMLDDARNTVRQLDNAVETLRHSAA